MIVSDIAGLEGMVGCYNSASPLFFDTETTGLSPHKNKPVAFQFHFDQSTYIVDMRHLPRTSWHLMRPMFSGLVVGHNLKFDLQWVFKCCRILPGNVWDTQIAEQVIHGLGLSDGRSRDIEFNLAFLSQHYTGIDMSKEARTWFYDLDQRPDEWNAPFPDEEIKYMELDVDVIPNIMYGQKDYLVRYPGTARCVDLERAFTPALAHVEFSGMPVNAEEWMKVIDVKEVEAKEIEGRVIEVYGAAILARRIAQFDVDNVQYLGWEAARESHLGIAKQLWESGDKSVGWGVFKNEYMKAWRAKEPNPGRPYLDQTVNINSPAQLMTAFQEMNVPAKDTSTATLERLEEQYPEVRLIMDYRRAIKFVQSFGEAIVSRMFNGRIHPDWVQIGASSMRGSCTKPNLQQIPSRSETGKLLRACVTAPAGWVILDADFSSQELVALAQLSGDENLKGVFARGEDPHTATARLMFHLDDTVNVKKEGVNGIAYRDIAKQINYGIAYGMTKYRLGRILKCGYDEAQMMIDAWCEAYPGAIKWLNQMKERPLKGINYSETLAGWKRYYYPLGPEPVYVNGAYNRQNYREFREQHRAWEMELNHLQNMHMNTPVQGTAAAETKRALTTFFKSCILSKDYEVDGEVQIIGTIHDEIVAMCVEEKADHYAKELGDAMDEAARYFLPDVDFPKASVHIGRSWEH